MFLLPSGLKQRKELQELRLPEPEISVKSLSPWQAHSVASFYRFKFCTKARLSDTTRKDLTSGTLPILGPMVRPAFVKNINLPYISTTQKDLGLGEEHMVVVIFDTFKGHTGSEIESLLLENNIISVLVPSNCTDVLQPLDLAVNKLLKDHLIFKFQSWYFEQVSKQMNETENSQRTLKWT